jgi:hypothetical protein
MQQDHTLSDDPVEIISFLVKEHGLEQARQIALEGTTLANQEGDFYRLSIWREVKRGLRDWTESPEEIVDEIPEGITDLAG